MIAWVATAVLLQMIFYVVRDDQTIEILVADIRAEKVERIEQGNNVARVHLKSGKSYFVKSDNISVSLERSDESVRPPPIEEVHRGILGAVIFSLLVPAPLFVITGVIMPIVDFFNRHKRPPTSTPEEAAT